MPPLAQPPVPPPGPPLRVALVVHGYPPELGGGTEHMAQSLARSLLRAGHDVLVIAGSDRSQDGFRVSRAHDVDPQCGRRIEVVRIHRTDLHQGHWTKSFSPRVGEAFEGILREHRPDVVHVHHWVRLTRDLVVRAARLGVPAIVTLHDYSSTCLVWFRVRPADLGFCEARLAPDPCIACAAHVFAATPWLSRDEQAKALERFARDFRGELSAARAVTALSDDQARTLERVLGLAIVIRTVAPASDVQLAPAEPLPPFGRNDNAPLVLGCWAAVHRLKGTDVLIEAVRELCARGVPVELHVAGLDGDPPFAQKQREAARGLPVHFHGPFERLAGHPVTRVHAFVAGTRARETWGVVLDEAIALRLPMVLPRFGAYASRFRDGDGVLFFDRADPRSLADVLARLRRETGLLEQLRATLPGTSTLPTKAASLREYETLYREAVRAGAPQVPAEDPRDRAADEAWLEAWDRAAGATPPPAS